MKKIVIIGGGSAGVWTALHYGYWTQDKDIEVELIYDLEIDPFPVGQGTTLDVVRLLWLACGTDWYHNEIRATPKLGILYENFSKENPKIYNTFPFDLIAMQADPKYLQKYILNSGLFAVKERNVTDLDTVDADVIFDCRGNTDKDDIEYESLYCPVNSVLLAISTMHDNAQNWTRTVATPDGWTFVIPNTTDTTSYGYLYNKDITPLETAKTNFSELFGKEFPNEMKTFNLSFESYMAKEPLRIDSNGRKIILNGNRLAFLEPMEATAIGFYLNVAKVTFDWIINEHKDEFIMNDITSQINKIIHELHTFISWHYVRGSVYDTPFWREAQVETTAMFEKPNKDFQDVVNFVKSIDYIDCRAWTQEYGQWKADSIKQWYDKYIK
ncbi:MAG: hypothetical protein CXT73_03275 [Methanobacteriota archaeon]|nr:MAG: hypothetical protein CXT73_03275 [Euryarchaeota archaeon]